jgi:hypothetical protein
MATLTETAFYARKAVNWGIIGLIGFIILRLLLGIIINAIRQAFPSPPLKADNAFGKLKAITFPKSASPSGQLTYSLQTITGDVPTASDAARVYFLPKNKMNLVSLSQAQSFAARLSFTATPKQITETLYRWTDLKDPLRSLDMDIVSNHFIYTYAFIHNLALFTERNIPSPSEAAEEVASYLQSIGLQFDDLNPVPNLQYLKIVGDHLEIATSQSQADAVRLDYFRKAYDGIPAVTDKPNEGNVVVIISGSSSKEQRIIFVNYHHWSIDLHNIAIYNLKTSKQAFLELSSGRAYFAKFPQNKIQIDITDVTLGYYDSNDPQYFLQPIFVFSGDNFMAYVPAVAPPWTE